MKKNNSYLLDLIKSQNLKTLPEIDGFQLRL